MNAFLSLAPEGKAQTLEYAWIHPEGDSNAPTLVFLHEGLGSIALWRDFPARLCAALNRRGLAYSRYGYGASTPRPCEEPLPMDYLEREAATALPAFLKALNVERPWLIGHSDGGSIALLAAAGDAKAWAGIVAMAPHYCVEEKVLRGIERARQAYETGNLRARLARYHQDVDSVFYGWCNVWLDPARRGWNVSEALGRIICPVLAIQGREDEYATLDQIEAIARHAPQTRLEIIEHCGHLLFLSAQETVLDVIISFIRAEGQRGVL